MHIRTPSQNHIVISIAAVPFDGAVPRIRSNRGERHHRPDRRCTYPTVQLTRKGAAVKRLLDGLTRQWARCVICLGMVMLGASPTEAHEIITTKITWGREISRVFSRRCFSCHQKGGPAFDLGTYEQARPWAEAIKEEVLERRMPPWGAVKGFGDFRDEDGLTEMEIALISSWVEGGAPRGDLSLLSDQSRVEVEPSMPPNTGETLIVSGSLSLKHTVKIAAVRPETLPEGASVRVIAERPNGAVEPVVWLYSYTSRFRHTYFFKAPMTFGAGTTIRIYPAVGSVSFLLVGG